ncbi:energy transducer TonB [Sphingomonas sp. GCM10030256]|uniref:energy transducer TonB n=1 Tax=Sphingomonas sp. GCM10030256 TaxID=3273427 RepID=UPI003614FAFC
MRSYGRDDAPAAPRARHLSWQSMTEAEPPGAAEAASPPDQDARPRSLSKPLVLGAGALALCLAAAAVLLDGGMLDDRAGAGGQSSKAADTNRFAARIDAAIAAADKALAASDHQPLPAEPMPAGDGKTFPQNSAGETMAGAPPMELAAVASRLSDGARSSDIAQEPPDARSRADPVTPPADAASSPAAQPPSQLDAPSATGAAAADPAALPAQAAPVREQRRVVTPARWVSGGLADSDNPYGRFEGTVSVSFVVGTSGQVSDCKPIVSSGNAELDAATCGLVERRMRFSPALDQRGQAIASEVRTSYGWGRKRRR